MGSVISYVPCPHCKEEAYEDYNYKTTETFVVCTTCGYSFEKYLDRKTLKKEGIESFQDIKSKHWIIDEINNPLGVVVMIFEKGSSISPIKKDQGHDEFMKKLKSRLPEYKKDGKIQDVLFTYIDVEKVHSYSLYKDETVTRDIKIFEEEEVIDEQAG